ncbi:MAG: TlpA family protein disulfide reductase [Pseudobacter sp.]|uniref:TlpA family protein disulfide reductase n=1 Tax=Pseudobacter sp. TaxID=2045420 RepID=UPI003F818650
MISLKMTGLLCATAVAVSMQAQTGGPVTMYTLDGKSVVIPATPEGKYWKVPAVAVEGYYAVSRSNPVYLAPGFSLEILPDNKGYRFKGKGSQHNQLEDSLESLAGKYFDLDRGAFKGYWWKVEPDEVFSRLVKFRKEGTAMIRKVKGSPFFNEVANAYLKSIERRMMSSYNFGYGMNPETMKRMDEMVSRDAPQDSISMVFKLAKEKELSAEDKARIDSVILGGIDINDEALFIASAAFRRDHDLQLTRMTWKIPGKKAGREGLGEAKFKVAQQHVTSPFIREFYAFQYVGGILKESGDRARLDSAYNLFMSLAKNERFRSMVQDVYNRKIKYIKGAPSPSFAFADTSGTVISLESLRGKYVYIDLWATWCGPCKAEIPYLKKLEAKYHDKNIAFVSISIDEVGDRQKWINFVRKEKLTGIQIMADKAWETAFVKDYTIVGIPHFILLGPAGEIIESKAKRPSEPQLEDQLKELLK